MREWNDEDNDDNDVNDTIQNIRQMLHALHNDIKLQSEVVRGLRKSVISYMIDFDKRLCDLEEQNDDDKNEDKDNTTYGIDIVEKIFSRRKQEVEKRVDMLVAKTEEIDGRLTFWTHSIGKLNKELSDLSGNVKHQDDYLNNIISRVDKLEKYDIDEFYERVMELEKEREKEKGVT